MVANVIDSMVLMVFRLLGAGIVEFKAPVSRKTKAALVGPARHLNVTNVV